MSREVNLIDIHGPNEDMPSFFEKLLSMVSTLKGFYIFGGDFHVYVCTCFLKRLALAVSSSVRNNSRNSGKEGGEFFFCYSCKLESRAVSQHPLQNCLRRCFSTSPGETPRGKGSELEHRPLIRSAAGENKLSRILRDT